MFVALTFFSRKESSSLVFSHQIAGLIVGTLDINVHLTADMVRTIRGESGDQTSNIPTSVTDQIDNARSKKCNFRELNIQRTNPYNIQAKIGSTRHATILVRRSLIKTTLQGRKTYMDQICFLMNTTFHSPPPPTIFKMIVDKAFGGYKDSETASGAVKGLCYRPTTWQQ